jgi:DNA-binding protein H-NS
MKLGKLDLKSLSIDELWSLHEKIGATLSSKIMVEKRGLEERLAHLKGGLVEKTTIARVTLKAPERRKYPPVLPKFRNPGDPSETWSGRGNQPRWLVSQVEAGNHSKRRTAAKRHSA